MNRHSRITYKVRCRVLSSSQLPNADVEYLLRLWKEETDSAVSEAAKYSSEKADQRKAAAEFTHARQRATPTEEHNTGPKNLPSLLQQELEEFKRQIYKVLPRSNKERGNPPYQRGRGRGRGRGRNRGGARSRGPDRRSAASTGGRNTPAP